MELFRELGEQIEEIWRDRNYNEEEFPDIAAEALAGAGMPQKVTAWEVLEWTTRQTVLPEQKDPRASFGDPPITLYTSPRFHIDVYFWFDGTTALHQHGFCGAFQVLHGSSIHSWYEFEHRESINTFTEIGDINLKVCELLEVGDIQRIWAGKQYIHGLFHLDQPSATIVVRTDKSPMYLPQYAYYKPHLAIDPFFEQIVTTKKLQSIVALMRANRPDVDQLIIEELGRGDFQTAYMLLSQVHGMLNSGGMDQLFGLARPEERFRAFLAAAIDRHGKRGEIFPAVFAFRDQQDRIVRQRAVITEPEHRFFLALLLNAEGRERIFGLIKKRFPDKEPLEKVLDWVFDMSQTRVFGAGTNNALGIADFDNLDMFVLENLLTGKSSVEMREALKADYSAGDAERLSTGLDAKIERIWTAVIFQPLLSS